MHEVALDPLTSMVIILDWWVRRRCIHNSGWAQLTAGCGQREMGPVDNSLASSPFQRDRMSTRMHVSWRWRCLAWEASTRAEAVEIGAVEEARQVAGGRAPCLMTSVSASSECEKGKKDPRGRRWPHALKKGGNVGVLSRPNSSPNPGLSRSAGPWANRKPRISSALEEKRRSDARERSCICTPGPYARCEARKCMQHARLDAPPKWTC